jgi:membrane-associated phospholipid phosphatase
MIARVDAEVASTLHAHVTPAATTGFRLVSQLGSTTVLVALVAAAAGYLARRGRRQDAAFLILALIGAEALTWSLKALFRRERPSFDDPVVTATSFSYPSGHALVSLAVYGALAYVLVGRHRTRPVCAVCVGGTALLVVAIGFTRLYLGMHYLSDVLAGYAVGLAWLLVVTIIRETRPFIAVSSVMPTVRGVRTSLVALMVAIAFVTASTWSFEQ